MNKATSRYPTDWKEIALTIKEREGWHCYRCGVLGLRPGERLFSQKDRPSQQLLRKLGGTMHRLPLGDAPKAARIDLGGSRGVGVNRRTSFATTGNAKEAGGCAVGIVWKL